MLLLCIDRPILNRYKTCTDAASVLAMQEVMLVEMEREDDDRRQSLSSLPLPPHLVLLLNAELTTI